MSGIESIIAKAKEFIGIEEGSKEHSEIINLYNSARHKTAYKMTVKDPWCAAFVVAVFKACGMERLVPCYAACYQMAGEFINKNQWKKDNPKAGDIIFYNWDKDPDPEHVGIVCSNVDGMLTVIEGNKNDCVSYRFIACRSKSIVGFGVPAYEEARSEKPHSYYNSLHMDDRESVDRLPVLRIFDSGVDVMVIQAMVSVRGGEKLVIDGEFGAKTEAAVLKWQKEKGLVADGIVGKETWASFFVA